MSQKAYHAYVLLAVIFATSYAKTGPNILLAKSAIFPRPIGLQFLATRANRPHTDDGRQ